MRVSRIPLGVLVEVLVERGELDAAETALGGAGRADCLPQEFLESWVLFARGRLRLAQGRVLDAVVDLEELLRRGEEAWRPWNPGIFSVRSTLALTLVRIGDHERARSLASDELLRARVWGAPRALGIALRACGLLEGGESGIAMLAQSVSVLDGSGAELERARSNVEWGAAMRRAGRRSDSRDPLAAGMEAAARCGAWALAAHAREELVAAGARPRRAYRSGIDSLTVSELRVARLAAAEMTNREIAESLFVTVRTVQIHLTNTYRKLDITGRAGLTQAL